MKFSMWQFETCKSINTTFYFWQKIIHPGSSHSSPKWMSLWIRVLVCLWLQKTQTTTPWYSLFSAFYLVQLFYGTIPTLWQSRGTELTNRYSFIELCIVFFEIHLNAKLFFRAFDKSYHSVFYSYSELITVMITGRVGLHSVLLPLCVVCWFSFIEFNFINTNINYNATLLTILTYSEY